MRPQDRLIIIIENLVRSKFYGKLEIPFEDGNIGNLKKTESLSLVDKEKYKTVGDFPILPEFK